MLKGMIILPKKENLNNQKFGNLTVISDYDNPNGHRKLLCKCDCGNETIVFASNLKRLHTRSCGCISSEATKKSNTKHGKAGTRLYRIFIGLKNRCYSKKNTAYSEYGGRGITVCQEWLDDVNNFLEWAIKNGYNDKLTIDRIDVNKGYSPDNCRFVDYSTQAYNKRIQSNNKTGYKGVYIKKNRYVAQINKNKKRYNLGSFETIEDAIQARKKAEVEFYKGS